MVWSKSSLFNRNIRQICPFMDLFHIYKKMNEAIWRMPQFFEPFIAPLMHEFYPKSKVFRKTNLKQIEITLTACRLVYPELQQLLLEVQKSCTCSITRVHLRNLRFFFEFLLPTVGPSFSLVYHDSSRCRTTFWL